jgi:hypothetical protein
MGLGGDRRKLGFLLVLIANLAACIYLALHGNGPALGHSLDQRYLTLMTWGFRWCRLCGDLARNGCPCFWGSNRRGPSCS